jgi:RNA recognition motif-containing protein
MRQMWTDNKWSLKLYNTFAPHGEITFSKLCTERETNRSRGFGFVSFKDKEAADKAIESLNGFELEGRTIEVKEAEAREGGGGGDRGGGRERGGGRDRGEGRNFGGDRPKSSGECFAFKKGNCKYGSECRFSHDNGGGSRNRSNDQYEDSSRKQHKGEDEAPSDEPRRDSRKKKTRE